MYVTAIHVHGLRNAEQFEATDLERVVELPGGPGGVAVADALSMLSASLDAKRLPAALISLGLARDPSEVQVLEEDGFPVQVTLSDPFGVPALLPTDGSRQITVSVDVELDPPLFGRLRGLAVRDPRLVTALGAGARVTIKVGWLFTTDLTVASVTVLNVAVGETTFSTSGSEKPSWLGNLLHDVGGRFRRVAQTDSPETVARRLLDAGLSHDPEKRSRYRRATEATGGAPFFLGKLEIVRVGERVEACFGPGLLRARQFGPSAADGLRLVEAVVLDAPDVLVVEAPGSAWRDAPAIRGWLEQHASGDKATLEQVIIAPTGPLGEPGGVA
jgi:hypothetical protein